MDRSCILDTRLLRRSKLMVITKTKLIAKIMDKTIAPSTKRKRTKTCREMIDKSAIDGSKQSGITNRHTYIGTYTVGF